MFKSILSSTMATKASGTLVLIIGKQHASWDLMVSTLPALELHFWCQLRIASARPISGPSGPCARVVVHVYVELANGLLLACIPSSGLLRLAWQQLDTHVVDLVAGGLHTVPRRHSGVHRALPWACVRWSQESKWDVQPISMTQYLLLDVYCKA